MLLKTDVITSKKDDIKRVKLYLTSLKTSFDYLYLLIIAYITNLIKLGDTHCIVLIFYEKLACRERNLSKSWLSSRFRQLPLAMLGYSCFSQSKNVTRQILLKHNLSIFYQIDFSQVTCQSKSRKRL